jgi:structural maintenance of chromosome 4
MKTKYNAPIDSQRLFDLVHADTYQNVVYWSIMDTLVVDNLEKALPIAYGGRRHRVVTLNGDFVDITGTMTSAPPSLNTKSIQ